LDPEEIVSFAVWAKLVHPFEGMLEYVAEVLEEVLKNQRNSKSCD